MSKKKQNTVDEIVEEFKIFYAPQDFKCGGCCECEGCLHYFETETFLPQFTKALQQEGERVREEIKELVKLRWIDIKKTDSKRLSYEKKARNKVINDILVDITNLTKNKHE